MGAYNTKDLKAYVRYDGSGRVVAGSLILRRKMPKVGKWVEISAYECCDPFTPTSTTTTTTTSGGSFTYIVGLGGTPEIVCAGFGTTQVLYSYFSTLELGVTMFYDAARTNPYDGAYGDIFAYGGIVYFFDILNPNQIINYYPCTTTTTTTVASTEFIRGYWLNQTDACNSTTAGNLVFYSASPTLTSGINIFQNPQLTIPVTQGYAIANGMGRLLVGANGQVTTLICP